jgi:hypothetical protein
VKERELIEQHGFITYPTFIDNHYVQSGRSKVTWIIEHIRRYPVEYAIAPDYQYQNALMLKRKYPNIKWIFPLHRKEEYKYAIQFDYIGFPHRENFRNYSLEWFTSTFRNHKKWYLGFWNESNPEVLLNFDGMDTTIPETYSGKYGKIWLTWNKSYKPNNMKTIDIFKTNLENFRRAVMQLQKQQIFAQFTMTLRT